MVRVTDYFEECRTNPSYYATASQRLLKAFGEPTIINTAEDSRLSRVFQNQTIKMFPKFSEFFGIEDSIESVYDVVRAASQGLEESRQILYLLGPVGSAKSSLADKIKELMEEEPIYVLAVPKKDREGSLVENEYILSPMYESPLGIIPKSESAAAAKEWGIPKRHFSGVCSPWAVKRLREFDGDISRFWVAEIRPSLRDEIAVAMVAPGDDNNQDISDLVGKVDVRMLEEFAVNDPDAYAYAGGLCKASQGVLDFVEMFKAPLKTLHPLLTATQEHRFSGTEGGVMPFNGIVLAHSNESEWDKFRSEKRNEAFLDRVRLIKVKYNLRPTEEQEIYRKLLASSELADASVAPFTLELLARTVIASRLVKSANAKPALKMRIYDGSDIRGEVANAPTVYDLKKEAGPDEGMTGISTRTAFKILAAAANTGDEVALDPVELLEITKKELRTTFGNQATEWITFTDESAKEWLFVRLGDMIRQSLLEDYETYAQTRFERYIAEAEVATNPDVGGYKDPDTGVMIDKDALDKRLSQIEKPGAISNPKDFRQEAVTWVLRYKARHEGRMPNWQEYAPMQRVIKKIVEKDTEELLPLISFGPKREKELDEKHVAFLARMKQRGFTEKQVRRIVQWYTSTKISS
ncbi:MAG: PrkA family serine protein kinase [Candidatus Pacebacteria bacterium]|nr:PrkA family serine protein kinase [Candidatus Paceibacterota bacterium]